MFVNSSSDDEEVMIVAAILTEDESKKKRKRSTWIHPINRKRLNLGEFHHLFNDLKEDENKFFQYFRMSPTKFSELGDILEHELTFQNTSFRRAVSKEERLAVALRLVINNYFKSSLLKKISSSKKLKIIVIPRKKKFFLDNI